MNDFIVFMKKYNTVNLWSKFKSLPAQDQKDAQLVKAMRHYDHTVNVRWVMAHYHAAEKYLGKADVEATGGSDWRKYMHPMYQKRIFFPDLWSEEEHENWGKSNVETVSE